MALRLSTGFRNKILGQTASLLLNGSFDSATTSWTGSGATLASVASGQSGNCLEVTSSGAALGQAYTARRIRHVEKICTAEGWCTDSQRACTTPTHMHTRMHDDVRAHPVTSR